MRVKQIALDDMRRCGLDVTFFLYDIWFKDGRQFNGGAHTKKSIKSAELESKTAQD